MRIYSETVNAYTVVSTTSTDYDFNGNKGTTHRILFLDMETGDIEKLKCDTEETMKRFAMGKKYRFRGYLEVRGGTSSEWKVCEGILENGAQVPGQQPGDGKK